MSEQELPLPRSRHRNPKIESIIGGKFVKIVSMDVYPCGDSCSKTVGTNIVKISEANYRDNPDLCMKIVVEALLSLPVAFYTIVYHTEPLPCVMDFRVGDKGCGLRVRPLDRQTINNIKHMQSEQVAELRKEAGDRRYWQDVAARYHWQLVSAGYEPDPREPVPPSQRPKRQGQHRTGT